MYEQKKKLISTKQTMRPALMCPCEFAADANYLTFPTVTMDQQINNNNNKIIYKAHYLHAVEL